MSSRAPQRAETVQLRVVDHLIVSAEQVFSFRRERLL